MRTSSIRSLHETRLVGGRPRYGIGMAAGSERTGTGRGKAAGVSFVAGTISAVGVRVDIIVLVIIKLQYKKMLHPRRVKMLLARVASTANLIRIQEFVSTMI